MTFKDGGAFDFHSIFERIKERLQQAVDVARESGQLTGDGSETGGSSGAGALAGVNMDAVHLDELPAYEHNQPTVPAGPLNEGSEPRDSGVAMRGSPHTPPEDVFTPPAEPPPGYEETQLESVADELERRLRNSSSS
jgi:WW domain-binding protein 2